MDNVNSTVKLWMHKLQPEFHKIAWMSITCSLHVSKQIKSNLLNFRKSRIQIRVDLNFVSSLKTLVCQLYPRKIVGFYVIMH